MRVKSNVYRTNWATERTAYNAKLTESELQLRETLEALAQSRKIVSDSQLAADALRVKQENELAALKALYESRTEEQKNAFEVTRQELSSLLLVAKSTVSQQESSLKRSALSYQPPKLN
jgi:precorrin isomerase